MIYDRKAHKTLPGDGMCGTQCFMSYGRLIDVLEKAGQARPYETITHIVVKPDGLDLVFGRKEPF